MDQTNQWPIIATAWATIVAAVGAVAAALAAFWAAGSASRQVQVARDALAEQRRLLSEDLRVRVLLEYEGKFDAPAMKRARAQLAQLLLKTHMFGPDRVLPDSVYEAIREDVPNFFESVGVLLRRGYLDRELAYVVFYHSAVHYWAALASYIHRDRGEHGADVWTEFREFVAQMQNVYREKEQVEPPDLDASDIEEFLNDEVMNA